MSGPRLSTVYDYTSLRIHPDGSRVNQTERNLRPRIARGTVRDSRGNWIARDAGGSRAVAWYRKVREESSEQEERVDVESIGDEDSGGSGGGKGKGKGKANAVNRRNHDGRPVKRQKYVHDFDWLETGMPADGQPPLPSSDLLKCIHYFSSIYYNERGQLFNASREYRIQRKQNKLRKLQQQKRAPSASSSAPEFDGTPEEEEEGQKTRPRRGGRVKGRGKVIYRKDMYKVMDGSALMVIGMLVQEYVAHLLEVRIPEGWEESVRTAYADLCDQDPDELSEVYEDDNIGDIGRAESDEDTSPGDMSSTTTLS